MWFCEAEFYLKRQWKTHVQSIHENNKNYICDTCDKRFTMKSQLDIHQKTVHENLKAFKCDSCEKTFGQIGHLKRHFRVAHEKLRPHSCEHCGKSFGAKWNLNFHVKTVHINWYHFIRAFGECLICSNNLKSLKGQITLCHCRVDGCKYSMGNVNLDNIY